MMVLSAYCLPFCCCVMLVQIYVQSEMCASAKEYIRQSFLSANCADWWYCPTCRHDRLSIQIPSVLVSVISKRAISNQMPFVPPNQLCITDDMAHKIGLSEMRTNTHPISSLSLHSLDPAGLSASSTFVRTHKSHLPAKLREELTSQLG